VELVEQRNLRIVPGLEVVIELRIGMWYVSCPSSCLIEGVFALGEELEHALPVLFVVGYQSDAMEVFCQGNGPHLGISDCFQRTTMQRQYVAVMLGTVR